MGMRSSQEDKRGNAREMLRRDVTEGKECFEGREKALGRVTRSQRNQQGSQSTGSRRLRSKAHILDSVKTQFLFPCLPTNGRSCICMFRAGHQNSQCFLILSIDFFHLYIQSDCSFLEILLSGE